MAGDELRPSDYISEKERRNLLSQLHRFLAWAGEKIPDEAIINGETVRLKELVWYLTHKEQLTEQEREQIRELARLLEAKEKHDEEILGRASLTREEAKRLYHECAGLLRAVMSLRDLEAGRVRLKEHAKTRPRVEDAKRWLGFLRSIGKRNI